MMQTLQKKHPEIKIAPTINKNPNGS